jgi:hypothetical protein
MRLLGIHKAARPSGDIQIERDLRSYFRSPWFGQWNGGALRGDVMWPKSPASALQAAFFSRRKRCEAVPWLCEGVPRRGRAFPRLSEAFPSGEGPFPGSAKAFPAGERVFPGNSEGGKACALRRHQPRERLIAGRSVPGAR